VEQAAHIPAALAQLRCSMQDPVVAIDLEWRPEFGRGFTPVAMVQLATSRQVSRSKCAANFHYNRAQYRHRLQTWHSTEADAFMATAPAVWYAVEVCLGCVSVAESW
jgi:hypothetical protein